MDFDEEVEQDFFRLVGDLAGEGGVGVADGVVEEGGVGRGHVEFDGTGGIGTLLGEGDEGLGGHVETAAFVGGVEQALGGPVLHPGLGAACGGLVTLDGLVPFLVGIGLFGGVQ